jgi:hypothetical protein
VPLSQLNEAKVVKNPRYYIRGVYLKEGAYEAFDVRSEALRTQFDLPRKYRGAYLSGNTLYGTQSSYEQISIPLSQIEKIKRRSDGRGSVWIESVYLLDGAALRFEAEGTATEAGTYWSPVIEGDSLHAILRTVSPLAIPTDQVATCELYMPNPANAVMAIGGGLGGLLGLTLLSYFLSPPHVSINLGG